MMNRYKNMVVLDAKNAEGLVTQIKSLPYEFSIISMYGHTDGRHYAYLSMDRQVTINKKRNTVKKKKSLDKLNQDINKEN